MTRDHYFEMCATLNSEPIQEEIPVEFQDLPEIAQISFSIYEVLRDEWDYMGGEYIGKNLFNIFEMFSLYSIPTEEHLLVFKIITCIDNARRKLLRTKK